MSVGRRALRHLAAGLAVLLVGGLAPAVAGTLADELQGLLAEHPQIEADRARVAASGEGEREAFSRFLPTLSVEGDTGYEHVDTPSRRLSQDGPLSGQRTRGAVELRQNVFDGFESTALRKIAETDRQVAEQNLRVTRQGVILEAVAAYHDVLRHAELVRLGGRNVANIVEQLQLEDERVQRGSGIAVDVLLAKSRLQVAKERKVALERAFNAAIDRYTQVFGHPPVVAEMRLPPTPDAVFPGGLVEAEQVVLSDNPAVQVGQLRSLSADKARDVAGAGDYPLVDVVAGGTYEEDVDGVAGIRRDYSLKVEFRWELFSGFATQARKARRAFEYNAARSEARFVERKATEEVRLAWHEYVAAAERRSLLANGVNIAGEVFDFRKQLRDIGQESAINVLDAENELFSVCINFLNAEFDSRILRHRVLRAMGRLTPSVFGLADPEAATATMAADKTADDVKTPSTPVVAADGRIDGAAACGL
jgi:adhesin transport system outer membrane protein